MTTISIHNLDPEIERRIREDAERSGKSLNQAIKDALGSLYGPAPQAAPDHRDEFLDLFGKWTQQEAEQFDRTVHELFEQIDPEIWS